MPGHYGGAPLLRVIEGGKSERQAERSARAAPGKFPEEEVRLIKERYGHYSGYRPRDVSGQTERLRKIFPGVGYADISIASQPLPKGAEGWFAIPRWSALAPSYIEAVERVLGCLKELRRGRTWNEREDELYLMRLRESERARNAFEVLGERQKGRNILVLPAQLGVFHGGRSVRRAREVMRRSEFGLGAYAVGIALLTHPERLRHYLDLWIDCAGDEYGLEEDDTRSRAPNFRFGDGLLTFDVGRVDFIGAHYGSATGFVV